MNVDTKRTFHIKKDTVLGLDIGSSAVKMVVVNESKAGYAVTDAAIVRTVADGLSVADRRASVVNTIRECFGRLHTRTKYAVCGVSGQEVAVRDFEFPPLQPDEIASAVSLEASQVCPFNATDIGVDYQVMPNDEARTKGILVAATNTVVAHKTQMVSDAGLRCVLMDVDGLALLNCYNGSTRRHEEDPTDGAVAILNIGASHTTLAIVGQSGWPFIRDMSHAGDEIIKQMAALNETSAERIREILFSPNGADELNLGDSLKRTCQKLVNDVTGTLRYYAAQAKSAEVDRVLVCGGFAPAAGFLDLLNNRLGIEAVLWNPFDGGSIKLGRHCEEICGTTGTAMVVATGLAMRTIA
jgi:type IV pilus assembly protein PilM